MKIRAMQRGDLRDVMGVYERRASSSVGLMRRSRDHWRRARGRRESKGLWFVAEDSGQIVGYAFGQYRETNGVVRDVIWHPRFDGTDVGRRLLEKLLKQMGRKKPAAVGAWEMPGSPLLPALRALPWEHEESPTAGVFMAGVANQRALLRDARRVLRRRLSARLRLRIDGGFAVVGGSGAVLGTASMDASILLGLLFGLRGLDDELKRGRVRLAPRNRGTLGLLRDAFPERRFWISDEW